MNQSLSIAVDVKPISYMLLSLRDHAHRADAPAFLTEVLPVGGPYPFAVTFHDDLGAQFDVTNAKTAFRLNRFEFLQVSAAAWGS